MKFDWRRFTETDYKKMLNNEEDFGQVYVGDICIELVVEFYGVIDVKSNTQKTENILMYNFYVPYEDTGYGYKDDVLPYDYADGDGMDIPYGLSYDEFKIKAEKLFMDYIESYKGNYSLVEHANRPLEIW